MEQILNPRIIGKWELDSRYFDSKLDGTGYAWFDAEGPYFMEFMEDGSFLENAADDSCSGTFRFTSPEIVEINKACFMKFSMTILEVSDTILLVEQSYEGGFAREKYRRVF